MDTVDLPDEELTALAFVRDKAPCGDALLHPGAWLRHLICAKGHPLPAGWTA